MKYRTLDPNGDYSFGKSMQEFKTDNDAVRQAIDTNLGLLRDEWWEDLSEGLPLFQSILANSGSIDHVRAADMIIKERILSTKGVKEIANFTSTYDGRKYSASFTVKTIYGLTEVTY